MTDERLTTTWYLGSGGDDVYARLMAAHEGLSDEDSARLNVRLVLLLMNQVGDRAAIEAAIVAARSGLDGAAESKGATGAPTSGRERS